MEMFILGLDGMDYDLAVKLNLENVLQEQYGKLEVPIDKMFGCPLSPEVWGSFLCAEHVKIRFKGKRNQLALNLLQSLKRIFPFISFGIGKRVTGRIEGFKKLDRKTWVDNPNVEEINVPGYSYKNETFQFLEDFRANKDLESYRRRLYWLFLKKTAEVVFKTKVLLKEGEKIDIVFAYLHYPDVFNHVWFTEKDTLKRYYFEINEFVGYLKSILKDTHLLIISDHGFDFNKNKHNDFGFISSNKKMIFPKSIIELGKQIKRISEENIK